MKLWSGRFQKESSKLMDEFANSISFDHVLYKYDITGSLAHAKMLHKIGMLDNEELSKVTKALHEISEDFNANKVEIKIEYEDIHMMVESLLVEKIGSLGKKIHSARSRNDQVALDIRLYLKEEIKNIQRSLTDLLHLLVARSEESIDVILPAYTHLQRAQPIRLAFYYMAYFQMFKRDMQRLDDVYKRTDVLVLGSGALAGVNYATDREFLREELGFAKISQNAMDSVSDRDFIIEFLSACSIIMMHLSRFCEELILWSSSEFNFISMDDAFSTGSSIMPQKKNPDVAELIRGKTGRAYGNLMNILSIMKSLPLAYNKDMQEDKIPLMDSVHTVKTCLDIFINMLSTTTVNKNVMYKATKTGFLNATDVADYLAKKKLPFREAHHLVGKIVFYALEKETSIENLSLEELKEFSEVFEEDIYENIDIEKCIENKKSLASTSLQSVELMINQAKDFLK